MNDKPRLIDANKIPLNTGPSVPAMEILDAPTIDAVPVEEINKLRDKLLDSYAVIDADLVFWIDKSFDELIENSKLDEKDGETNEKII